MNILLVMPDARIHRLTWAGRATSFREAPLTLTTLAALVPPELGAEVRVVDESVEKVPVRERFDLVGISCLTGTAPRAYELARAFRETGATTVLGGVHVTLMPHEARRHADAIVTGYAEESWPALLRDLARGELKPHYHSSEPRLTGLPPPRRDLQRRLAYAMPQTVFATRGCRGGCDFCTIPALGGGWQTRPVHEVIDEIRHLPARRFAFNDVNLTDDRDYAMELFTALAPLKRQWGGLSTVAVAQDQELLETIARSGCVYLLLGFESLDPDGLSRMGKQDNRRADYRTVVAALHDHRIAVQGCFIFGLDSDTPEVFDATVDRVNALGIDIPRYAIYTPYPGTRAFRRLHGEGRILDRDWRRYDTQHVVFRPARMTAAQLRDGLTRAYVRTFSLRAMVRRTITSPRPTITLLGNCAYRRYANRLRSRTVPGSVPAAWATAEGLPL